MDLWKQIEMVLSQLAADDDVGRRRLRALADRLPSSIQSLPAGERARAQALGAEALYRTSDPKRVIFWSSPVLGPATSQWVGRALLDLGRPAQAVRHFEHALNTPGLAPHVRAGLDALVSSCKAAIGAETVIPPACSRSRRS